MGRPNIQNIPIRTEEGSRIRDAFFPDRPSTMDYALVERELMSNLCRCGYQPGLHAFHQCHAGRDTDNRCSNPAVDREVFMETGASARGLHLSSFRVYYCPSCFEEAFPNVKDQESG